MAAGLDQIFRKARSAEKKGDAEAARRLLQGVLDSYPDNVAARTGIARLATFDADGTPPTLDALAASHQRGDHRETIRLAHALAVQHPSMRAVPMLLGAAHLALGDPAGAEAAFRTAIRLDPDTADHRYNLGLALSGQGRHDAAQAAFEQAVRIDPDYVDAHVELGKLHVEACRPQRAIEQLTIVLDLAPEHPMALYHLGSALAAAGHVDPAIDSYRLAARVDPANADAHCQMGNLLAGCGRVSEAIDAFARTVALQPGNHGIEAQRLYLEARLADWRRRDDFAGLPIVVNVGGHAIGPFTALAFEDDPERQLQRSRVFAASTMQSTHAPFAPRPRAADGRIRIGYFSADFYNHATLLLIAGLLREHDRTRFEIRAYDFSPPRDPAQRALVADHVDALIDLRGMTDADVIDMARGDALDIAVDLKGYTRGYRAGLFAARMAPVQIAYLGYPGSMGAAFIDYLVADPVVVPVGTEPFYDETLIRLPHSYQPNDDRRAIASVADTRRDHGLPDDGFVFCSFNHAYKIGPREFDVWMRLLAAVPGSVLWLLDCGVEASANLRAHATARGVDPARLVFAANRPHAEHLARQVHADLFLDTFAVNAHTTASDALWAGLPVVTLAGRQFAARVAASVLTAVGLPDLVTTTEAEYEALAVSLASSPTAIGAVRARLAANRLTRPLFDSAGYTRHLEAAFEAVHRRAIDGLPPAPITIG